MTLWITWGKRWSVGPSASRDVAVAEDGSIALSTRAWAVKVRVASRIPAPTRRR
jgi:hypothetical protein